jgi:hypothetical protein
VFSFTTTVLFELGTSYSRTPQIPTSQMRPWVFGLRFFAAGNIVSPIGTQSIMEPVSGAATAQQDDL